MSDTPTWRDLPTPKALFVDMDGTLVDTEPWNLAALVDTLAWAGLVATDADLAGCIGVSDRALIERLRRQQGTDRSIEEILREKRRRIYERFASDTVPLRPGAEALLARLQERTLPWSLVTTSSHETVERVMASAGIDAAIPQRVCWEDTPDHKPHPAPYLLAAQRLGVDTTQAWALEDSEPGVRSAVAAGCMTIACGDPVHATAVRGAGAMVVCDGLQEVVW